MLELKIKAKGRRYVAPADLREIVGAERAREKLADAIEALVAQLDMMDGDPDLENDLSDFELSGDEKGDPAWCEWHTLPAATRRRGALNGKPLNHWRGMILEDEEDDDPREEDDDSGQCTEDEISSGGGYTHGVGCSDGPGCEISDLGGNNDGEAHPAYAQHDQREPLPWSSTNDVRAWRPHRDRVRRNSCTKETRIYRGMKLAEYALRDNRVGIGVANDLI